VRAYGVGVELADYIAIRRVIDLYPHLIDGRRWDELGKVFSPDAVFEVIDTGAVMHGPEGIAARFSAIRHPLGHHQTDPVVEDGASPDEAVGHTKLLVVRASGRSGTGMYDDRFVRTEEGWRIQHRVARLFHPA